MKENEALSAKAHKKPTHPWKVRVWISKNNDKKAWINFEKSLTNNTPGKEHSKWDVACSQQEKILTWWAKKGYPSKIILCFMHFGNYSKNWVENLSSFIIFSIIILFVITSLDFSTNCNWLIFFKLLLDL